MIILGCSDKDEATTPITLIQSVRILDVGNNHNASDIYLELTLEEHSATTEIKVFIAPAGSTISEESISSIPETSFQNIPTDGNGFVGTLLRSDLKDTQGNSLVLNTEYKFLFAIAQSGGIRLSGATEKLTLTNAHPLEGEYVGRWDDNIYTNFPISARINSVNNSEVSGPFFYTSTFRSCCGGRDDGDITLTLDGTSIKAFRYDQDLLNYKGGCPGLYSGSGSIANFVTLEINFTGNDCDGVHTGGRISLTKKK